MLTTKPILTCYLVRLCAGQMLASDNHSVGLSWMYTIVTSRESGQSVVGRAVDLRARVVLLCREVS